MVLFLQHSCRNHLLTVISISSKCQSNRRHHHSDYCQQYYSFYCCGSLDFSLPLSLSLIKLFPFLFFVTRSFNTLACILQLVQENSFDNKFTTHLIFLKSFLSFLSLLLFSLFILPILRHLLTSTKRCFYNEISNRKTPGIFPYRHDNDDDKFSVSFKFKMK